MLPLLRSLAANRHLLRDFVVRDLKVRYVGSSLGFFWSIVYPLMNLAVYVFVFQIVLKTTWGADQSPGEVVLLMLVCIVAWSAFAECLSRGTNILVDNAGLIEKVVFPAEILPAYVTLSAMINMMIALPVVGAALAYAMLNPTEDPVVLANAARTGNEGVAIGIATLSVPLLLLLQTVFTLGLCYFLSAFNLFWRDTFQIIGVLTMVWMFITPIFYPDHHMVQKGFGWMLTANPVHWLMDMYRGAMVKNTWPDAANLARFAAVSLLVFAGGTTFFQAQKEKFADLL